MFSLIQALENQSTYPQTQTYRKLIINGNKLKVVTYSPREAMQTAQQAIVHIMSNPKTSPISYLMALKFAQDTIDLFDDDYVSSFQHTVLPKIEEICLFQKESTLEDRGKYMFTKDPQNNPELALYGNSLLTLALESIWTWSKWFPIDPDLMQISAYKITLERLIIKKVKFPVLIYYDPVKVEMNMPQGLIPLKALHQCQNIIRVDLLQHKAGSPYKKLLSKLIDITSCLHDPHLLISAIDRQLDRIKQIPKVRSMSSRRSLQTEEIGSPNQKPIHKKMISKCSSRPLDEFRQLSEQFQTNLLYLGSQELIPESSPIEMNIKKNSIKDPSTNCINVTPFPGFVLGLPRSTAHDTQDFSKLS